MSFNFSFHLYGFFIGLGVLAAFAVSERALKRISHSQYSLSNINIQKIFFWIIIPGLLGARVYHVIDFWDYYSRNLMKILATWEGGMGIWGGIVGGMAGLGIYSVIKLQNSKTQKSQDFKQYLNILISEFLLLADIASVGLPLGQAIGRMGNFFNQELYGLPTNLPWGIYISPRNRLAGYEVFEHFHPLFAYEAVWCLLIFAFLQYAIRLPADLEGHTLYARKAGILVFTYIGLYGFGRFFLEFLRINPWQWGILTVGQWFSLVAIISSLIYSAKGFKNP